MKQTNKITTIGPELDIDLVDLKFSGLPAKVDTGADSSVIWASHIRENDGQLTFILFDKSSRYYSGETITASNYEIVSIKSSFGTTQYRYKVPIKVKLSGRVLTTKFTLANRSRNRFPVLIGRKTISGKFLVDVSKKPAPKTKQVLMLSTKRTDVTKHYADNLTKSSQRFAVTYASYDELVFYLGESKNRIELSASGRDIASFDLVYFKTYAHYRDVAAATASYLSSRHVPFIDTAVKYHSGDSKLCQYMALDQVDVNVPQSIFMLTVPMASSFVMLKDQLGLPFVLKDIHGNKGEHNYLVVDEATFTAACVETSRDEMQCVAQKYIENDRDYRVLVLGRRIALVIERTRGNSKSHLNNTSKGAKASLVPKNTLPASVRRACLKSSKVMRRQIAGIDMVRDSRSDKWYCLEVNDGPQLASGSFVEEKFKAVAKYLDRELS